MLPGSKQMKYPHKTWPPPPPPSPLGDIATAKTSSVLTQGSNTSVIIKEVSLQHHETIKDATNLYSWQAQRQRASKRARERALRLSPRLWASGSGRGREGGVVCLCMRMCVFVHSRLKKKKKKKIQSIWRRVWFQWKWLSCRQSLGVYELSAELQMVLEMVFNSVNCKWKLMKRGKLLQTQNEHTPHNHTLDYIHPKSNISIQSGPNITIYCTTISRLPH